jgi:hypothetical protein
MKRPIFWGITAFSELEVNRRFGGTWRLHLLCYLLQACFWFSLFFDTEDGHNISLRNVGSLPTDYTVLHPKRKDSWFPYYLHVDVEDVDSIAHVSETLVVCILPYEMPAVLRNVRDFVSILRIIISTLNTWAVLWVLRRFLLSPYYWYFIFLSLINSSCLSISKGASTLLVLVRLAMLASNVDDMTSHETSKFLI